MAYNFKTTDEKKQEEGEKPKVPRKELYTGMKKINLGGAKKKKPKGYKDLIPFEGKPKMGLSAYQKKNFNTFIKAKEGETKEQWEKRTRNWRVLEEREITELPKTNKLKIMYNRKETHKKKRRNTYLVDQSSDREFNFMKYYGAVMNFYCIKLGIRKDDFEVAFYFYENTPFTKEQFENVCVLNSGGITGKFARFIKNKYLVEVIHREKRERYDDKLTVTGLYKLSRTMVKQLTLIYQKLAMVNILRMKQATISPLSNEIKEIFHEMNREIIEIQSGKKPQEKLE